MAVNRLMDSIIIIKSVFGNVNCVRRVQISVLSHLFHFALTDELMIIKIKELWNRGQDLTPCITKTKKDNFNLEINGFFQEGNLTMLKPLTFSTTSNRGHLNINVKLTFLKTSSIDYSNHNCEPKTMNEILQSNSDLYCAFYCWLKCLCFFSCFPFTPHFASVFAFKMFNLF